MLNHDLCRNRKTHVKNITKIAVFRFDFGAVKTALKTPANIYEHAPTQDHEIDNQS